MSWRQALDQLTVLAQLSQAVGAVMSKQSSTTKPRPSPTRTTDLLRLGQPTAPLLADRRIGTASSFDIEDLVKAWARLQRETFGLVLAPRAFEGAPGLQLSMRLFVCLVEPIDRVGDDAPDQISHA
jgi:hypothetical protein